MPRSPSVPGVIVASPSRLRSSESHRRGKSGRNPEEVNLYRRYRGLGCIAREPWAHDIRQCARLVRVSGTGSVLTGAQPLGARVMVTVWVRNSWIDSRLVWHRLQSPHRIAEVEGLGGSGLAGGRMGPWMGRRTALTRRGPLVSFP